MMEERKKKKLKQTAQKWKLKDKKQKHAILLLSALVLVFVFGFVVPQLTGGSVPVNGGTEETEMTAGEMAQVVLEPNVDIVSSEPKIEITESDDKKQNEFFATYRLERSKTRGQQLEMLEGIVNNEKSSNEMRDAAQEKILAISDVIEEELLLENILSAKYDGEAVVFIQEDKATVMLAISEDALPQGDAEQVARLVTSYTEVPFENVVIMLDKI